jgi:hypothetical protein
VAIRVRPPSAAGQPDEDLKQKLKEFGQNVFSNSTQLQFFEGFPFKLPLLSGFIWS